MQVTFYNYAKKVNSTARPSSGGTNYTCRIKTPSSILKPVLEISTSAPINYNYAYISLFSRYYWVIDTSYVNGLWVVSLEVDVLATYKSNIGNTNMYILRSSAASNGAILDTLYPATGDVTYSSTIFDAGATYGYQSGYYILSVLGTNSGAGQTLYQLTPSQFQTFMSRLMASADGYDWGDFTAGFINSLFNPLQYISSCFWFPESFTTSGSQTIYCGLWNSGVAGALLIDVQVAKLFTVDIPKHPQASARGKYCNLAPFTQYGLDLGVCPTINLDTSMLIDVSSILVSIHRDPMTGVAVVEGRTTTANNQQQLFKVTTPYGVPVDMAQGKNNIAGAVTSAVGTAVTVAGTGGTAALIGAGAGLALDAVQASTGSVSNSGSIGTIAMHKLPKRLFSRFFKIADDNNTNEGRPLCAVRQPKNISGYMIASKGVVSINGTQEESQRVNNFMTSGFYYE